MIIRQKQMINVSPYVRVKARCGQHGHGGEEGSTRRMRSWLGKVGAWQDN